MAGKILVVVDMQEDFTRGALRNEDGIRIIPKVAEKIAQARAEGAEIIFTRDTHTDVYLETEEGKNLPVPHCIKGTAGWEIVPELTPADGDTVIDKETFGSFELGAVLRKRDEEMPVTEVELIGLCTDICVISNALLIKAFLPNAHIKVDPACCAGVTPESHETALAAMQACHVEIMDIVR